MIVKCVSGKKGITPETALRLAKYVNMAPQFWPGLQMDYELDVAEEELAEKINREVQEFEVTTAP